LRCGTGTQKGKDLGERLTKKGGGIRLLNLIERGRMSTRDSQKSGRQILFLFPRRGEPEAFCTE